MFSNPFLPSTHRKLAPSTLAFDSRKISPKTSASTYEVDDTSSPSWTAPESWAVEKDGEDPLVPEYSSSEDSVPCSSPHSKRRRRKTVSSRPDGVSTATSAPKKYIIRIYRANGSYHVVSIDFDVTAAELTPQLKKKLLMDADRESHRLYLKERGRERVLAPTERPAGIVRRRLEQAGYDPADGLDLLGAEDTKYLMKFVYKSNALGPADEELNFDNFDLVDLTGRSLRTVPVLLYPHAEAIVLLNLSRNPMLEIPLDFIQSCTTLRELRLQHMAMKKVPQSVRHCRTLHRLDLSCNRIVDLDDAGLDAIPELRSLKVQNNRLDKLPSYFPALKALKDLNISNNHFRHLPSVVSELTGLVDLDISFNMISELPEGIGRLQDLERFIIVGNQVSKFPIDVFNLVSLRMLDCRRNHIAELSVVSMLPKVEQIFADHNAVHALDLSFGRSLEQLDASHNDITQLNLILGPMGQPFALTSLDISHAKLSALDEVALAQLTSLRTLRVDHNSLRSIPDTLGVLTMLTHLSCSNNQLLALPSTIGRLQKLETLEAHNNSLAELPATMWSCASLQLINVTSNFIGSWSLPHVHAYHATNVSLSPDLATSSLPGSDYNERKASTSGSRPLPPLVLSLEKLYLGENRLTDDTLHPLALLKELRVLNLSFNEIQDMPSTFFRNLTDLKELYLSGNSLSAIPTEDLHRMSKLEVLFLNGNKLQTLPKELGKIPSLMALDVGSNILKYNVFNWQFDWNWNFNQNLRYLNLSGNKRLEIRPDMNKQPMQDTQGRKILADFSSLTQLRILGLMDVTATFGTSIPDENEDRRVRTSVSEVNGMGYGIADTLGRTDHLNMLDLVKPQFREREHEAVFAMFGRATHVANNPALNKQLHDELLKVFSEELERIAQQRSETIPDALRRTFLKLNKKAHDELYKRAYEELYTNFPTRKMSNVSATSTLNPIMHEMLSVRGGASGVMLYFVDQTLYVANAGDALAVISRQGVAELLSLKHDPFNRAEIARIRQAEGWVSPKGCVNDEVEVARSFGFYNMLPVVNARPHIRTWQLNDTDEFVIVGNSGLWDVVSYQTAVDIARSERADPMIAAQKLRDFAISYGAEGTTMIMVISVADLFTKGLRSRQPTMESVIDAETFMSLKRRKRDEIKNKAISRLDNEVEPPTGHVALVFTDIRNSTHLWDVNAGMATAMVLHNNLLRRQLRFCGGYEVKTEGDAFMCSFPTALNALWWALSVQVQLLHADWPLEILECEDGKEVYDSTGRLIARGLSVRMGIHCGQPVCEPDPITHRMDYFGPMVNRSARISGSAAGGQIMCSADVVREINARIFETGMETDQSHLQSPYAIDAIRRLGSVVVPVGEVKLKGLELPEMLSLVYPDQLAGRQGLRNTQSASNSSGSRVQFSVDQMRELALLCIRLETLSSGRVFRLPPERKDSSAGPQGRPISHSDPPTVLYGDPKVLLPAMDNASDMELMLLLDSLTTRIENALNMIALNRMVKIQGLSESAQPGTLQSLLSMLPSSVLPNSIPPAL
ncbi:adenylate cyclase-like protein [Sparassis latifolia]